MFKECSWIFSDLIIELDTCNKSIIDCFDKQEKQGRIRILKKSKPYKVGKNLYTNIKYCSLICSPENRITLLYTNH